MNEVKIVWLNTTYPDEAQHNTRQQVTLEVKSANYNELPKTFTGIGFARLNPADKFNADFGLDLAFARACINALKGYERSLIRKTAKKSWQVKQEPKTFEVAGNDGDYVILTTDPKIKIFFKGKKVFK
jgi:hypothetical protein